MGEDVSPSRGESEMVSNDTDPFPASPSTISSRFATDRSERSAGLVLGMLRRPEPACSRIPSAPSTARRISQRRVECQ
jgi:hypothetical protein